MLCEVLRLIRPPLIRLLQQGLEGSLRASRYLGKNTEVVDGSLHIFTLLFSFRIYIDYIASFAVEIATH